MSKKKWLSLLLTLSMVLSLLPTSALADEDEPTAVTNLIAANLADHGSAGDQEADDQAGTLYAAKSVTVADASEKETLSVNGEEVDAWKVTAAVTKLKPHYGAGGISTLGPVHWIGVGVPGALEGESSVKVVYNWLDDPDDLSIEIADGVSVGTTQVGGTDGTETYTGGTFYTVYFGAGAPIDEMVGWIARTATLTEPKEVDGEQVSEETTYYLVYFTGTTRYFPLTVDSASSAVFTLPETSVEGVEEISDGGGTATGVLEGTENVTVTVDGSSVTGFTLNILAEDENGSPVEVTYAPASDLNTATFDMPEGAVTLSAQLADTGLTVVKLKSAETPFTSSAQTLSVTVPAANTTLYYVLLEKGADGSEPKNAPETAEALLALSSKDYYGTLEVSTANTPTALALHTKLSKMTIESGKTYKLYYIAECGGLYTPVCETSDLYIPKAAPALVPADADAFATAIICGQYEVTVPVSLNTVGDETAEFFYLVQPAADEAPQLSAVLAGTKVEISKTPVNVSITGLNGGTEYKIYYTVQLSEYDDADTVKCATFTTATQAVAAPTISITQKGAAEDVTPTTDGVVVKFTSDKAATLYYMVKSADETEPKSTAVIVAEDESISLAESDSNVLTITGLLPNKDYKLYCTAKVGSTGTLSGMVTVEFTTVEVEAPTLTPADPTVTRTGTTASFELTSSVDATLYYLVLEKPAQGDPSGAPKDAAALVAASAQPETDVETEAMTASTPVTVSHTGTAGTTYVVYYTAQVGQGTPAEMKSKEITILKDAPTSVTCSTAATYTAAEADVSVSFGITSNAAGTLYYQLLTEDDDASTLTDEYALIKASEGMNPATKTENLAAETEKIVTVNGLTGNKTYTLYYTVREDEDGAPITMVTQVISGKSPLSFDNRVAAVKSAISEKDFTLKKEVGVIMGETQVKAKVEEILSDILSALDDEVKKEVTTTVDSLTLDMPPADGSLKNEEGTPGVFSFTVTVKCVVETVEEATDTVTKSDCAITVTAYVASTKPASAALSNNTELLVTLDSEPSAVAGTEKVVVYADQNKQHKLDEKTATEGSNQVTISGLSNLSGNVYVCVLEEGKQESDLIASTGYEEEATSLGATKESTADTVAVEAGSDVATVISGTASGEKVILDATVDVDTAGGDKDVATAEVTLTASVVTQMNTAGATEAAAESDPTMVEIKTNVASVGLPATAVSTLVDDTENGVNASTALTLVVEVKETTEVTIDNGDALKDKVSGVVSVELKKKNAAQALEVTALPDVITLSIDLKKENPAEKYKAPVLAYLDENNNIKRVRSSVWDPYTETLTATTDHLTDFLILDDPAGTEPTPPAPVIMRAEKDEGVITLTLEGYDANTGVYCTVVRGEDEAQATVSIGVKVKGAVNASTGKMPIAISGEGGAILLIAGKGAPSLAGDGNLGITIWDSKDIAAIS